MICDYDRILGTEFVKKKHSQTQNSISKKPTKVFVEQAILKCIPFPCVYAIYLIFERIFDYFEETSTMDILPATSAGSLLDDDDHVGWQNFSIK